MPSTAFTYPQQLNVTPLAASGNASAVSLPPKSQYMGATFFINFTKGSLTNATFTVQGLSVDGSTWCDLVGANGGLITTGALVANATLALPVVAPGCKQLRVRYVSTGTVTSSAVTVDCSTQSA